MYVTYIGNLLRGGIRGQIHSKMKTVEVSFQPTCDNYNNTKI